jgi:hypothetical protein
VKIIAITDIPYCRVCKNIRDFRAVSLAVSTGTEKN